MSKTSKDVSMMTELDVDVDVDVDPEEGVPHLRSTKRPSSYQQPVSSAVTRLHLVLLVHVLLLFSPRELLHCCRLAPPPFCSIYL